MKLLIACNAVVCLAIFITSFARGVKMGAETRFEIVLGTNVLGVAAIASAMAPFVWSIMPTLVQVLMELAILLVQTVTHRLWFAGVPQEFQRDQPRGNFFLHN